VTKWIQENDVDADYAKMDQAAEDNRNVELPYVDTEPENDGDPTDVAYLLDALGRLNIGDTPALAGDLTNAMSGDYSAAGDATESLRNYDGSQITHPCLKKFFKALKESNVEMMAAAASCLLTTNVRIPNELDLFEEDADATAYNNFKLVLGQIITEQLTGIPVDEGLRDTNVVISPYDNVVDPRVDFEKDVDVLGLSVTMYDPWDTRALVNHLFDDVLIVSSIWEDTYEVTSFDPTYESALHGDIYEVVLYNQFA
jgi:hypothetical protein